MAEKTIHSYFFLKEDKNPSPHGACLHHDYQFRIRLLLLWGKATTCGIMTERLQVRILPRRNYTVAPWSFSWPWIAGPPLSPPSPWGGGPRTPCTHRMWWHAPPRLPGIGFGKHLGPRKQGEACKGAALSPATQSIFPGNLILNHWQRTCFWVRVSQVAGQLPCCDLLKVSPRHKGL